MTNFAPVLELTNTVHTHKPFAVPLFSLSLMSEPYLRNKPINFQTKTGKRLAPSLLR